MLSWVLRAYICGGLPEGGKVSVHPIVFFQLGGNSFPPDK
jgi:hypothetical protein